MNHFQDKTVLITGVCGTIGRELLKQLVDSKVTKNIIGLDNNESELFFLQHTYRDNVDVIFFLNDVRDYDSLNDHFNSVHIVIHTAALKHVEICEYSPFDAVQTNVIGVQNLIKASLNNDVELVLFTSSDKAVNPTNVMGTTKLMGERLFTAANSKAMRQRNKNTIFASTRFGNVLGSNGSVVSIFRKQISQDIPLTVTDEKMTRFVMSVKQAANLVLYSASIAKGGEVFITKMPVLRIVDLAKAMWNIEANKGHILSEKFKIDIIGAKPGEKMYEELMSDEETGRSYEMDDFFVVLPAFKDIYSQELIKEYDSLPKVSDPFNSENEYYMSIDEIASFLEQHEVLV